MRASPRPTPTWISRRVPERPAHRRRGRRVCAGPTSPCNPTHDAAHRPALGKQTSSSGTLNPRLGLVYWWNPVTAIKLLRHRPPATQRIRARLPRECPAALWTASMSARSVRTTELALSTPPAAPATRDGLPPGSEDLISMSAAASIDRFLAGQHALGQSARRGSRAGATLASWQRLRLVYGWQKRARLVRGWHAEQLAPPFAQSAVVDTVSANPQRRKAGPLCHRNHWRGARSTSSGTNLPGISSPM